jgi:hypothetical protein
MPAIAHYIAQCLLKNFCTGKKARLWAYDKSNGKSFQTTVGSVAAERDFYKAEIDGVILSLEEGLSEMEGRSKAIIDRIIADRSIGTLTENDHRADRRPDRRAPDESADPNSVPRGTWLLDWIDRAKMGPLERSALEDARASVEAACVDLERAGSPVMARPPAHAPQ